MEPVRQARLSGHKHMTFAGVIATAAGWGKVKESGKISPLLQKVDVPILYNRQCKQWMEEEMEEEIHLPDSVLCAGLKQGGRDTCQGDSGGPLFVPHWTGRRVLAGVTSWGIGCANPKLPGIYTRVAHHIDWILATIARQQYSEINKVLYRHYLPPFFYHTG